MFQGWDGFYLLIGSASAGLIGLLFVVTTLMADVDRPRAMRAAALYTTPIVFHFAVVLVVSALSAVPRLPNWAAGLVIAAGALAGMAYAAVIAPQMRKGIAPEAPHWSDFWCYGVAPGGIYLGLGLSAATAWFAPAAAAYGVGLALLALLLISIRNAWDLVTWLAPRGGKSGDA